MALKTRLAALLATLFGRVTWEAPRWLGVIGRLLSANRRPLLVVFVLGAAGAGVYTWKVTRPPPPDHVQLEATVRQPSAPPRRLKSDAVPPPVPAYVTFDGSAAPLELVGKPVTKGVTLRPAIEGEWRWFNERTLAFTPKAAWPIGVSYTVSLSQALVDRPNVDLVTHDLTFATDAFAAELRSFEFYQDPVDPSIKQVVGTFRFNYPVDVASFERRLSLRSAPLSNPSQAATHKFTVTYDDLRFEAYVRSEVLPLPIEDHTATLALEPGTKADASSATFDKPTSTTTTIPGKGNKFRVSNVQVNLARNAEGDPDQVLIFDCSSQVNEKVFAPAVKVWVLPKDKPAMNGDAARPNYPWAATEVGPDILKLATRLKVAAIPGEQEVGSVESFKFEAKPGATLFVRVEAGIEAYGGYTLLKPFETTLTVPEYPREIKIAHEGSVLSVSGDKKLTITARGVPAFRVHLYRIQPKDLNHLITQSAGDFAHFSMRGGSFNEENISEVFTEIHELDASNPRVAQYAAVDFSKYLKDEGQQRGMYFVRVEAWNPVTKAPMTAYSRSDEEAPPPAPSDEPVEAVDHGESEGEGEVEHGEDYGNQEVEPEEYGGQSAYGQLADQRFILLTDLGVVEKVDVEKNHWVYVQSFRTGAPVGGTVVEVLAKNGSVVARQTTDANGALTLSPFTDFTAEKAPVALVARHDGDVSFLPLNRYDRSLDLSRFDVGGVHTRGRSAALSAFTFTDRGLYRPGETAHLGAIVRAVDWARSMKGTPLQLRVTDPRGLTVALRDQVLDAAALASLDFRPEENAPTGTYTFEVAVPDGKGGAVGLGSTTFRVEEFLPDRMRLTTHFDAPAQGWVTGSKVKALADLKNLFGTPAADHRVTANVLLSPYTPHFSKYPDFQFFDPARAKRSETVALNETQTDGEGRAEFEVDLSAWAPSTWLISFYAEGFELGGGRGVSSSATIVVSPRAFMLGFKPDGEMGFVKRNAERKVEVIAVDPKLAQTAVKGLTVALVEQRYVSVLTRESNGSYRYQSVLKDVTKKSEPFSVDAKGTTLKVPSADVGTFYWSVRDKDDTELLRVPFTIAGEANVAKELEKNAELKVSLDKAEYEPGETISVHITAPYAGAGVVTIERDKVLVHKPFKTTTSTTVQTIDVPAGLEVNGYVSVAFVRSVDSPELYVSPLSYGVVPFKVLRKSQHLQLTLTAPELTKPGRPLAMKVKADRPAKAVVFAVDEGILQVANYTTPDPLGFFLEKRALEVQTRQIVDLLLPEFRLVHGGGKEGGDSDGDVARNLNPFKRKADAPAVFWSGVVDVGPDEKTVSFVVPESFNGQLRVMAVAASPEALAAARTSATVRGPFVISPNTPLFVSPKDTFVVTAAIANNVEGSGDQAEVTVTMKPSAAFTLAAGVQTTQTLKIAERREGLVSFDVQATDVLGDGELQFQVSGMKQEATRTAHVSVRPSTAYWSTTQAGSVRDASVDLKTKRTMFDQLANRQLTVSLLPLGMAASAVDYLDNYPHLCSEQLTSRAVPALVLMKRPEWGYDAAKTKTAFDRAFNVLRSRQNEKGQFGYWAANSFNYDPLDVFITLMLTEAKDRGVSVPNDVRLKALENLKGSTSPVANLPDARIRAQTLYVLARNAVVAPAPTAQLAEFLGREKGAAFNDVAYLYLAATYALTNNKARAEETLAKFVLADEVEPDAAKFYDSAVYRGQVLYLVSRHFPAKLEKIGPQVLSSLAKATAANAGYHSLSASWSLLGLDAYSTTLETSAGSLNVLSHVTVASKDAKGVVTTHDLVNGKALTAKVAFTAATTGFTITSTDGALVFYSLAEGGFDRELPSATIHDGVEVLHTFEDDQGREVTRAGLGDEVNVHVRMRSLKKDTSLRDLALVDLLPSGFEVVLTPGTEAQGMDRLVAAGATWRPEQVDIREDRVIFYGSAAPNIEEFKYRIKAVAKGRFVVPPAQVTGMYSPEVRARSTGGSFVVE